MLELPFRLMVIGDLSCGSSTDREVDLEPWRRRSLDGKNRESVMQNMRMSLSMTVPDRIDEANEETPDVTIPIENRRSFNPERVAKSVPKVRSLLLLRQLLLERQAKVRLDDLAMRAYPFRAAEVEVTAKAGRIGFYDCKISILLHIQFEGMDVELRLESRLG